MLQARLKLLKLEAEISMLAEQLRILPEAQEIIFSSIKNPAAVKAGLFLPVQSYMQDTGPIKFLYHE